MRTAKYEAVRVNIRITKEMNDKLDDWAGKFGITKSQLGGMSLMAGFDAIIRTVSPVDSLNEDQLAKIFRAVGLTDEQVKVALETENTKKILPSG